MSNPEDDQISMLPSCSEDDEVSTISSCPGPDHELSAHDVDNSPFPTSSKCATEGLMDPALATDASRKDFSEGKEGARDDQGPSVSSETSHVLICVYRFNSFS